MRCHQAHTALNGSKGGFVQIQALLYLGLGLGDRAAAVVNQALYQVQLVAGAAVGHSGAVVTQL